MARATKNSISGGLLGSEPQMTTRLRHRLDAAQGRGTGDRNAIGPADPDSRLDLFLANSLTSLGASHYGVTNSGARVEQLAGRA